MSMNHSAPGQIMIVLHLALDWAAVGIEMLAAAVIVTAVVVVGIRQGTVRYLFHIEEPGAYRRYKLQLIKPVLMALELLVAADVVRTVALEPTLNNVGVLALLVVVRTFLSWSLAVEMEGRWPWQAETRSVDEG